MIFLNIGYYIQLLLSVSQGGLRKGAAAVWDLFATQNHLPQAAPEWRVEGLSARRIGAQGDHLQRQDAAAMLESKRLYREYARTAPDVATLNAPSRARTVQPSVGREYGFLTQSPAVPNASKAHTAYASTGPSASRRTASWLASAVAALFIVALVVIPVAAAANVQSLWSNEPPLEGLRFGDFDADGRTDVFRMVGNQWQFSSAGTGPWQDLFADPSSTALDNLRFGDFNGDRRTDVFSVSGTQWRYSSAGLSSWIPLASDPTPLGDLRFGDFDGDGRTDVFGVSGTQWRYSSAGVSNWANLATDPTPLADLRFGDFDGDDRTDVFSVMGDQWRYSSGGAAGWANLATDPTPLQDLRFGDFDSDGRSDVFSVSGSQWRYSSGAVSNWAPLASDPTPLSQLRFGDFDGDRRTDVFSISSGQWRYSSGGVSGWIFLTPAGSTPTPTSTPTSTSTSTPTVTPTNTPIPPAQGAIAELRFGDFDGDARTDVFRSQAGQWQFSSAGVGPWQNLAYDPLPLIELRFGDLYWDYFLDFNADGRTDVFSVSATQWRYSNGGAANWIPLATDSTPLSELRFGDFDGDGRTDVFSTLGGQWRYSSGGTSNWTPLASDSRPIQELRFGDFNGDGRTDVFSVSGTQWQYSSAGVSNWIPLASDPTPLQDLRFGDFDGDGRTDVFSVASDGRWRYSPGGASNWVPLAIDPTPLNQLRFGDFNGDGRTDVFSIGPDGRWRYSSGGASNWILLGPPGAIASPTPTGWPTTWPTPTGWPTSWPPPNTATPPSGNCVNIAVNSDMESNGGWMFGDSPVPAIYSSAQRRSGTRSVQMGILPDSGAWTPNSYSSVRQPITIPHGATTAQLRWWHLYYSQEPPTENPGNQSDRQEVILLTPGGHTLKILQRVRRNDGTWQADSADLSNLIGQTFYIYFNTYNDGNPARTWMYLDDVIVEVCSSQPMPVNYSTGPTGSQPYSGTQPYAAAQNAAAQNAAVYAGGGTQPYYVDQYAYRAIQPATSTPVYEVVPLCFGGEPPDGLVCEGEQPYPTAQPMTGGQPMPTGSPYMGPTPVPGTQPQYVAPSPPIELYPSPYPTTVMPLYTPPDAPPGAPEDMPYVEPLVIVPAAPTLTPTPAPIEMPTSIPTVVIVVPAVPDIAVATPLPAIPADAVEAQVLRVIDGETIEVRIVEEVGPDAVNRSSPAASILTNFRTASIGDASIFGWRPRIRGRERVAQVETVELVMVVRYADIEAPELDTLDGLAAAAANRELVEGQTVFLEFVDLEPDAEGAIPAYVFLPDGELVNAALVLQGHAVVAPSVADSKYEERLLAAQTLAQENGNGMWALAPTLPEEVIATLEAAVPSDTPAALESSPEVATALPAPTDMPPPEPAAPSPCVQLVRNGSFEEGDVYWNLIEGASPPVITSDVAFGESGQSLRLGIVDGENVASISAADQLVELPADAYSIVLSVRYLPIFDGEPGPGDLQYIDIYNAMTGQFAGRVLSGQRNDGVWLAANYDLALLKGQPIRVVFAVNNDGVAGSTAMYIDDVSILACETPPTPSGAPPAPAPDDDAGDGDATSLRTVLSSQNGTASLTTGPTWLSKLFTGAVMLGILTIIGFAALVIMNSSSSGGSGSSSGDKGDGDKSGDSDKS